jgi:hypothetical protein
MLRGRLLVRLKRSMERMSRYDRFMNVRNP